MSAVIPEPIKQLYLFVFEKGLTYNLTRVPRRETLIRVLRDTNATQVTRFNACRQYSTHIEGAEPNISLSEESTNRVEDELYEQGFRLAIDVDRALIFFEAIEESRAAENGDPNLTEFSTQLKELLDQLLNPMASYETLRPELDPLLRAALDTLPSE